MTAELACQTVMKETIEGLNANQRKHLAAFIPRLAAILGKMAGDGCAVGAKLLKETTHAKIYRYRNIQRPHDRNKAESRWGEQSRPKQRIRPSTSPSRIEIAFNIGD